jgi:hypothetical protein
MKDTSVIPEGAYCYTIAGPLKDGRLPIKKCPYWSIDSRRPKQENGYCSFLGKGDWELSIGLLWDQCKECGENWGDDPYGVP